MMPSSSTKAFPETFTVPPPEQPKTKKPGQLSQEQLDSYFDKGFVILENFIDLELLERLKKEWDEKTDDLVERLFKAGKIKEKHQDKDFFHRMMHVEKEFHGASVLMHKQGLPGPVTRELWSYPKLLDALEQILGSEIVGHPVWNIRIKLPGCETADVPWHQDNGYLTEDAAATMIATAWIPMLDTGVKNGGMRVVANSHRKGLLADHQCCAGNTWYIELEEEVIESALGCNVEVDGVNCKVPYGGVLLFNNLLAHRSVTNVSDGIRWSMDLRWQDPRKPNGRAGIETVDQMPLMRSEIKPVGNVDWSGLCNRMKNDIAVASGGQRESNDPDEFDTRIGGYWMKKWPIKHHNRHTAMNDIAIASGGQNEPNDPDEFDTRIGGYYMKRWPIRHHNRHTALVVTNTE